MTAIRGHSKGQTLVEFALVLPVIILIIFGTLDFARAVFTYNTLSEAAKQGARVAIVNQDPDVVADEAVTYAPATGLTAGDVSVCFKTPASLERDCDSPGTDVCQPMRPGCLAIVIATLDYQPLTPLVTQIAGNITLSSTSVFPIEFACITGCPT